MRSQLDRHDDTFARVLRTRIDRFNEELRDRRVATTRDEVDAVARHLREKTIPAVLSRGETIETLLPPAATMSSSAYRYAGSQAVENSPSKHATCVQCVRLFAVIVCIVCMITYTIAVVECGGALLHRCIR